MLISDPPRRSPRPPRRPTPAQLRRRRVAALACFAVSLGLVIAALASLFGGGVVTAEAVAAPRTPVTIQWVGDITPGSSAGVPPGDGSAQFAGVQRRPPNPHPALPNPRGPHPPGG